MTQPGDRQQFFKMSGSGNDFIFFDVTRGLQAGLDAPTTIRALCARGSGVGADGVVFIQSDTPGEVRITYYNSDGSLGELCGNATLCATRLACELGMAAGPDVSVLTDSGVITGRMANGAPQIDLAPVTGLIATFSEVDRLPGETSIGFVAVGVPHIVILVDDVESVDVVGRGSFIRRHKSLSAGANVNFVGRSDGGDWLIRTYERGVEGETLACGTGAVATGLMLTEWGSASWPVALDTRSGRRLEVGLREAGSGGWSLSLKGSADFVFAGELRDQCW